MAPGCPDEGAAQKILADTETEHIVVYGPGHWTVTHPLRDRLGDLASCPVHEACARLPGPPGGITGRYRVKLDSEDGLVVELLSGPESHN